MAHLLECPNSPCKCTTEDLMGATDAAIGVGLLGSFNLIYQMYHRQKLRVLTSLLFESASLSSYDTILSSDAITVMTKVSARHSITDSEIGSIRSTRASKLGAILCPTVCALLLVCIFAVSFIGTKLAYDQYDAYCTGRRFDVAKLYIFPNFTIKARTVQ